MADVTFLRPAARDEFGDRPTDDEGDELVLSGVKVAPSSFGPGDATEPVRSASDPVREALDLFTRERDVDVAHDDVALYDGNEYRVVGMPKRWGTSGTVISIARELG